LTTSPYINHFIQPDTIIPNPADPQSWNRYSYGLNNPVRYTDPSGHSPIDGPCGYQGQDCGSPIPTSRSPLPTPPNNPPNGGEGGGNGGNGSGECNGLECELDAPIDPGNYLGGYNGPGGGLQSYHINGGNGNGGASVSVNYSAWYDVLLYENAMVIILHEGYWIPPASLPHLDDVAFGGSVLHSQGSSGEEFITDLGEFSPGKVAKPRDLTYRDTSISFLGRDNFPSKLVIEIQFGASYLYTRTMYYQLDLP
jgi:hypothetical protein